MADPSKEEEQELSVQLKARACFVLGRSQASRESERESHSREFDSFGLSKLLLGKKKKHTQRASSASPPPRANTARDPGEEAVRLVQGNPLPGSGSGVLPVRVYSRQ